MLERESFVVSQANIMLLFAEYIDTKSVNLLEQTLSYTIY